MSTRVTLRFITDEDAGELTKFLHDVRGMLNTRDNEEGRMINLRNFQYWTEQASG